MGDGTTNWYSLCGYDAVSGAATAVDMEAPKSRHSRLSLSQYGCDFGGRGGKLVRFDHEGAIMKKKYNTNAHLCLQSSVLNTYLSSPEEPRMASDDTV